MAMFTRIARSLAVIATVAAIVDTDPEPLEMALSTFEDTVELVDSIFDTADCADEANGVDDDNDGYADDGCGDDGDPAAVGRSEHASGDCTFGIGNTGGDIVVDVLADVALCPIALGALGIQASVDSFQAAHALALGSIAWMNRLRLAPSTTGKPRATS